MGNPQLDGLYERWCGATGDDRKDVEGQIYELVRKEVSRFVPRRFPEGKADLIEDISTTVFQKIGTFNRRSPFTAWVHGVAKLSVKNALRNLARKNKVIGRDRVVVRDPAEDSCLTDRVRQGRIAPVDRPDLDTAILYKEIASQLPPADQRLLYCKTRGWQSEEIAADWHIGKQAVYSRSRRLKGRITKKNLIHNDH